MEFLFPRFSKWLFSCLYYYGNIKMTYLINFPQLLRLHEHMVTVASHGVTLLIQTFGDKFVLTEIIKEISRMGRNNTGKETSASGIRNFTQFLTEVSSSCPQMIVPSLSLLTSFLDEEVNFSS